MSLPLEPEIVRALDRETIRAGFPGILLMEVAGFASFGIAQRLLATTRAPEIVVLSGPGNNAGDGFCLARHAAGAGLPVRVVGLRPGEAFSEGSDTRRNAEWLPLYDVATEYPAPAQLPALEIDPAALVVDALLGTGVTGAPRPEVAAAIARIARHPGPVLALDIPSGLCPRTGVVLGEHAVRATQTATYGALKTGLVRGLGPEYAGEVTVIPLPFPPRVRRAVHNADDPSE